jgi:integrase/recombinase XerD
MGIKLPQTITEEEFVKVIKKVRKNHHKAAFILGFYQGLRVSEVINLKPENIRFNEHIIEIKQAKGKKDRHIPIVKPLLMGEQTVIRALRRVPITCSIRALQISFKGYVNKVLKRDLHFHTLRHGSATWLLNKKKWDSRQVQRFLGHSRLETVQIYTHVSPQDLVDLEWDT